MIAYAEVRSWPDVLEDAARSVRGRKDQVVGLQDELDLSFGPPFWHGGDSGVRDGVDSEVTRASRAAEEIVRSGRTDFSMTGAPSAAPNP